MKIAFLTRIDAFDKNGGDTYQIEMYKKYLEGMGHSVVIVEGLYIPDNQDYYILVNLDRPLELIVYYEQLVNLKLLDRTLLLAIHHSYRCIDYYEKNIRTGISSIPLKLLSSHFQREKLKNLVRVIKYPKLGLHVFRQLFIDYELKSREIIGKTRASLLIATGEKKTIYEDFGVEPKVTFLVKNGVDLQESCNVLAKSIRDIDILICGRIEPRKNSIAIVDYLLSKSFKVVFAGSLNPNAKDYCEKFIELVNGSENIKYVGRIHSDDMSGLYSRAKINLSASWFEVASLVDLEAYAYGCHVISSENGHTKDYLDNRALYVSPLNISILDNYLPELIERESNELEQFDFINHNFTWEGASRTLNDIFINLKKSK
jgi:hypothetical protein